MADAQPEVSPDEAAVRRVVTHMLTRNDWYLLDANELARRVLALLNHKPEPQPDAPQVEGAAGQKPARPWRRGRAGAGGSLPAYDPVEGAALYEYSEALYAAYANRAGEEQQQRAYYELFRYVFRAASRWAADLSRDEREEITYHVLAELYFRLVPSQEAGQPRPVRVAGAFLAIALQQMKNTVRQWRATARHWTVLATAADERDAEDPTIDNFPSTNGAYDPDHYVERSELHAQVMRLFTSALQQHPRAQIQLHVVLLHQLESLDYPTIANRLGMTVENVRVLYCRGIKRLRDIPSFRALAEEEHLIAAHQPTRDFEHQPDIQREHGK